MCALRIDARPYLTAITLIFPILFGAIAAADASLSSRRDKIAQMLPRVVYHGGPFLRQPDLRTVTFANDELVRVRQLEEFGSVVMTTLWWRSVTAGYCDQRGHCVGRGRAGSNFRSGERLQGLFSDFDIERRLTRFVESGAIQHISDQTLVLVYLPKAASLRDAYHEHFCGRGPRAYHRMARSTKSHFAYAVVPHCGDLVETTTTASHEILEATLNPDPNKLGFSIDADTRHTAFGMFGKEPADLCNVMSSRAPIIENGFALHQAWSNAAATQGLAPCADPSLDTPFFSLIPRATTISLHRLGVSEFFILDAVSSDGYAPWSVRVSKPDDDDISFLNASLNKTRVRNGGAVELELRLSRRPSRERAFVFLESSKDKVVWKWPLLIEMSGSR